MAGLGREGGHGPRFLMKRMPEEGSWVQMDARTLRTPGPIDSTSEWNTIKQ